MEPPEMAVFSFIDLPDVLTHEIKRRTHHEKRQTVKRSQALDNKIDELAKTTRKLKQVRSESSYQFHGNAIKQKPTITKRQKWILVNKQGRLSGILDHRALTLEKVRRHGFNGLQTSQEAR